MKKIFYIFLGIFISNNASANQPVDWQLGFQKAASETMRDIEDEITDDYENS